ncbi:MerR family transcriptional regulator [Marinitenerispora sediminis]|uniref:MerR family transcriptional regulator n=1 Tax=Marinitenerispora sediminis TaxID=1931232 RepID=A0A368T9L8_9ACTN|nr:MerR family transcriptional regulator [Marinitenerispora sediminis]RCV54783.1 MerR family transcriptional regulator [Marinitenerispora sediminis]RCV60541.1 MerR family transcriptional regulator [Marinitenerispora sediminis]RCV61007.1 MerR family transcriptional regulator [Marinitenerispora sediminis]
MFTIGDFAKHGRVSVRMLRHYDAIGLLRPARVDPATGYRYYEAGQLARLNRVIALKDLGFTLRQVRSILGDRVSAEELRGMLRLRRAELETAVADTSARLARVEARLRTLESEGAMSADDIVVKTVPPVRLAELTGSAASYEPQDIGPVVGPLFEELCRRLEAAGVPPAGPALARYADAPGGAVTVHAGMPVAAHVGHVPGAEVVELPAVERVAAVVHRGTMADVLPTAQALARWIDANGYRSTGYAREVTIAAPEDPAQWVTELQEPVAEAAG